MPRIVWVCAVASGSVCERVARVKSAKRSRSTTVRPTRPAAAHPAGHPVDRGRPGSRRAPPAARGRRPERPLRADRAAPAADLDRARVAVVGQRVQVPAGGPAEHRRPAPPRRARRPRRPCGCPGACSFAAVTGPTPHSRSTGSGCRNASSPSGGDDQQPVRLGHPAGHLGQELGAGHADRDRQADPLGTVAAQPRGDLQRRPRDPAQPADVEERLVDGDALDQRRGVAEDLEHRLAGLGVGRHPRRHDDRLRAQRAGPAARPSRCARRSAFAS